MLSSALSNSYTRNFIYLREIFDIYEISLNRPLEPFELALIFFYNDENLYLSKSHAILLIGSEVVTPLHRRDKVVSGRKATYIDSCKEENRTYGRRKG
jgi:hypothetical protein